MKLKKISSIKKDTKNNLSQLRLTHQTHDLDRSWDQDNLIENKQKNSPSQLGL